MSVLLEACRSDVLLMALIGRCVSLQYESHACLIDVVYIFRGGLCDLGTAWSFSVGHLQGLPRALLNGPE